MTPLEPEFLSVLGSVEHDREIADYAIDKEVTADDVRQDVEQTRRFLERIEALWSMHACYCSLVLFGGQPHHGQRGEGEHKRGGLSVPRLLLGGDAPEVAHA